MNNGWMKYAPQAQAIDVVKPPEEQAGWMKYAPGAQPDVETRTPEEMEKVIQNAPQELPFGAISLNKDGTAYYGEGAMGWYKGLVYQAYAPVEKVVDGETVLEKPSFMTSVGRAFGNAIGEVGKAFSIPQKWAYGKFGEMEAREYANRIVNNTRPNVYKDPNTVNLVKGLFNIPQSMLSDVIGNNNIEKTGERRLPIDMDKIEEASEYWYKENFGTSIYQPYLYDEFMKRVINGEDPYALTKEMGKPVANLVSDIILDPLNFAGFILKPFQAVKVAKGAKVMDGFADATKVMKLAKNADDVVDGQRVTDVIATTAKQLAEKSSKLVDEAPIITGKLTESTQHAKFSRLKDVVNVTVVPMLKFVEGSASMFDELMFNISKVGSKNADEVAEGLTYLQNKNLAHIFTTENSHDTARFIKKFYDDMTPQKVNEFVKILKTGNVGDTFKFMSGAMDNIAREMFPDVATIANKQDEIRKFTKLNPDLDLPEELAKFKDYKVSNAAKKAAQLHDKLQHRLLGTSIGVKNINDFLSLAYLSSPGFFIRNAAMNTAQTLIDFGIGGAPKAAKEIFDVTGGSVKYLEDVFGLAPDSLKKGFGMAADLVAKKDKTGLIEKAARLSMDASGKMEEHAGVAISAAVGKRLTSNALKRGAYIADMNNLKMFNDDALNLLEKLVRKHNGKTKDALAEFVGAYDKGALEYFREPEMILNDELVKSIGQFDVVGLMEQLREAMSKGTIDDVMEAFDKVSKRYYEASKISQDIVTVSDNAPEYLHFVETFDKKLSDDMLELFGKKVTVRNDLLDKIEATASQLLDKKTFEGFVEQKDLILQQADEMQRSYGSIVNDIMRDNPSAADVIHKVSKSKLLSNMSNSRYAIHPADTQSQVIEKLYAYAAEKTQEVFSKTVDDIYANMSKLVPKQNALDAMRNRKQVNLLSDLNDNILSSLPYLQATRIKDGKVMINRMKYWYDVGDYHKSLLAYADHLELPHRVGDVINKEDTMWQVIADKLGVPVGDVYREENYTKAMGALREYADEFFKRPKKTSVPDLDVDALNVPLDDMPPIDDGEMKSIAQALKGNSAGFTRIMDEVKDAFAKNYNKRELVSALDKDSMKALQTWATKNEANMVDFRRLLINNMKETRDFILHDYAGDKKNFDLMLAYIMPYQFWYSRTYSKWLQRLAANPAIINRYSNWRKFLADQNKDLPSYMQNNIVFGESFGLTEGNELILNLEATFNPMNGLTGIDFDDKKKIVGSPGTFEYAWTNTLNSIGKYGPSVWTPITALTAAYLSRIGEQDAARRWAGRAIPVTAPIKAIGSMAGMNIELDPFVHLFGEGSGTDPYEERRVGRALGLLQETGQMTKEQAFEAARTRSGEDWEKGVVTASKLRSKGTISAYMLGVGMKMRTKQDAEIDKFYEDYYKMWANADKFTPEEMRLYQNSIHQKYQFGDLILLSSKGGLERDKAYSYSVLSRIQPGRTSDVFTALGIDGALVDKFYESKGDFKQWDERDRDTFVSAIVQLGTLLSIPSDATAEEWGRVKAVYAEVNNDLKRSYGDSILEKIDVYYSFNYGSIEQEQYLKENPDVEDAMNYKDYLVSSNQLLAPYYDGLKKLGNYYEGQFRKKVADEVDPNFYEYYDMRDRIIDPAEKKKFETQIGWTAMYKKYIQTKKEWDTFVTKNMALYEQILPKEIKTMEFQEGDKTVLQQEVIGALAEEQAPEITWEQISEAIPMPMILDKALTDYFSTDRILTSTESSMVSRALNAVNEEFGMELTRDELMSIAQRHYGTIGY